VENAVRESIETLLNCKGEAVVFCAEELGDFERSLAAGASGRPMEKELS